MLVNKKINKRLKMKSKTILLVLALVLTGALTLPLLSFSKENIYVDTSSSGTPDGSQSHPYTSIQDAIDEAGKKDRDVYIREGTYEQNFKIEEGVEVNGAGKDKVFIKSPSKKENVVTMYDETALRDLSVQDGKYGIKIKGESEALVKDCLISNNKEDGINISEAKIKDSREVKIYDCEIKSNGWNGIYSEKRQFVVEGNEIENNEKEGIEFLGDSEGVISKNRIKDNGGNGVKLTLGGSKITVKKNTIRKNDRDGIEVKSYGDSGNVWIRDNKIIENERWGIAKVSKEYLSTAIWNQAVFDGGDNIYYENDLGNISPVIRVY